MQSLKQHVLTLIKKESVLSISLIFMFISCFLIPPNYNYINYIDVRVIVLLFCLMSVVALWQKTGAFYQLGLSLSHKAHSTRGITYIVVCLCFFSSMVITNDVALITFVPFTITLFTMGKCQKHILNVLVIETIAANLGSMLTPIGNPQNLYLFSLSGMTLYEFITHMLPLTILSFIFVFCLIRFQKNENFEIPKNDLKNQRDSVFKLKAFWIATCLFIVCLANVFHLLSYMSVFVIVSISLLLFDCSLFKSVDYSLLITFIALFIFIGNMGQIPWIATHLQNLIQNQELLVGILSSQVISNVPAAMLLSKFTSNYADLLWGVNIGGLGTIIASMASLISYKYYINIRDAQKGRYFIVFTQYNLLILIFLIIFAFLIK